MQAAMHPGAAATPDQDFAARELTQLQHSETLTKATEVFGSREKAEEWMNRPAMGLDGRRPIEMLQTAQGTELVTDFLTRLEYDVYS